MRRESPGAAASGSRQRSVERGDYAAVNAFLGAATTTQFSRDTTNLTVTYSGSPTDYTFRRFILHYANLCVIAGGVDLFLFGSELRGLEIIRGPDWTPAGATDANGHATWDYPFVAGLDATRRRRALGLRRRRPHPRT